MRKISKLIMALAAAAVSTIFLATPTLAWGPERTTYTNNNPAPEVTFNSITDNAAVGDERNFVRVTELGGSSKKYVDTLTIEPGKEYEVYIYYHNNAASNLNASGKGIANGVKVSTSYPTIVRKGEKGMVSGIISATDSNPPKVWDEAYFTTSYDEVVLRYKTGTAVIHNAGKVNGSVLSSNLFTKDGTYIGINTLDGRIPGCAEYSGYITYTLVAERTAASLEKQVSLDGKNWSNHVDAKAGEYVTYRVEFINEGNTKLSNVIFKDAHNAGLSLRPGSTIVYDVNNINGKVIDDIIDISGYNVGEVAPGALIQIIYQAKVSNDPAKCNQNLENVINAEYNSDTNINDDASVSVVCDEPEPEPPHGSIKKTASKANLTPGEEVEFRLAIKNTGSVALTNVVVKDALPAGLTFVRGSARLIGMGNNPNASLHVTDDLVTTGYNISRIEAGKTVYVTYRAKATGDFNCEGTAVTNTATITYDNIQPSDNGNTTASTTVVIKKTDGCDEPEPNPEDPHGSIEKTTAKATATPGEEIEFKIIIKNTSAVELTNVVVKDVLPTGLALISGSAQLSSGDPATTTNIPDEIVTTGYNIGRIGAGETVTITYRVKVDEGFDCVGSSVTNTASFTYDGDQTSSDHTASSTVTVKKVDGCNTEPDRPTEIVNTGPLEITMAVVIIAAIAGAGGYYWYTHRTLKTVENKISGKSSNSGSDDIDPKSPASPSQNA